MARSEDETKDQRNELVVGDLADFLETAAQQNWPAEPEKLDRTKSYRFALGQEPIQLGTVEFRILLFLASRPYYAFKTRAIAEAVSSEQEPVTEDSVAEYISSLRDQLGVFYDYVQTVPHIGYRFKE